MFLGPSGLQPLTPEIKEVQLLALENSIAVLKSLGKIQDKSIKPSDVRSWIDATYLEAAAKELNTSVEEESAKGSSYVITGKDAYDKSTIEDPKMAAQIWFEGDKKVKEPVLLVSVAAVIKNPWIDKGFVVEFSRNEVRDSNAVFLKISCGISNGLLLHLSFFLTKDISSSPKGEP